MDLFRQTLTAGIPYTIPLTGRYFRILTGTGKFRIKTDNGIDSEVLAGLGCNLTGKNGEPFHSVQITAINNTQQVELVVADFPVDDSRLSGDVDINGVLSVVQAGGSDYAKNSVTIAAAANEQILEQKTTRISATIHLSDELHVWKDNTVSASDMVLPAGYHTIENTAALYAYNNTAASVTVKVLEELI